MMMTIKPGSVCFTYTCKQVSIISSSLPESGSQFHFTSTPLIIFCPLFLYTPSFSYVVYRPHMDFSGNEMALT